MKSEGLTQEMLEKWINDVKLSILNSTEKFDA